MCIAFISPTNRILGNHEKPEYLQVPLLYHITNSNSFHFKPIQCKCSSNSTSVQTDEGPLGWKDLFEKPVRKTCNLTAQKLKIIKIEYSIQIVLCFTINGCARKLKKILANRVLFKNRWTELMMSTKPNMRDRFF